MRVKNEKGDRKQRAGDKGVGRRCREEKAREKAKLREWVGCSE